MALYQFSLGSDEVTTTDIAVIELSSPADVVEEAGRILADMARDELRGRDRASVFLIVQDDEGRPVFVSNLSFAAVFPSTVPTKGH
ncbi:hypothetical protein [Rhizobium sp. SSA_523]|uniref:DUF6894 family protein n=1 Tax=Rhizobium sp. SSA_523 TaxID=2952477 RepID=UPI0020916E4F|nr:hypothetical protein [Rhizobium sp. SSA_523]MCO5730218.1 hypothetical protein [Rhizobium sp. SSA_523]WKC25277.1 hypothetical protein QTJ18_14955 [Rhizobium sp. SSA_523]